MPPKHQIHRPFSTLKKLLDQSKVRLAPDSDKPLSPPGDTERVSSTRSQPVREWKVRQRGEDGTT